ncbi:hypothetical protein ACFFP0_24545 [Rhizobium puerariae]|uniref:Uncharacterized protein n=1 Tax=Rhizobium puerariae TaxID=1585791 RepID=A0ABV6AN47_9HYPH
MSKIVVPSSVQPISGGGGIVTTVWQRFFNALVAPPAAVESVSVSASPFAYKAAQTGSLAIMGGTVTDVSFKRAGATVVIPGGTPLIPVANGDEVTITYSAAPTISFIPM